MTTLAGSTAKTGVYSGIGGTGSFQGAGQTFVAVASGTVTDGFVWLGNANLAGGNVVVAVYNSTGSTLLGHSAATAITVGGFTDCTFSSGPTLASGMTYGLVFYINKKVYFDAGNAAASLGTDVPRYSNPASDPTTSVPATYSFSTNPMASDDLSIYVTGSSGTAYTLTAAMGSFGLTGEAASRDLAITAAQGSFALAGKTVTFQRAANIPSNQGAFALTGNNATLFWSGASATPKSTLALKGA